MHIVYVQGENGNKLGLSPWGPWQGIVSAPAQANYGTRTSHVCQRYIIYLRSSFRENQDDRCTHNRPVALYICQSSCKDLEYIYSGLQTNRTQSIHENNTSRRRNKEGEGFALGGALFRSLDLRGYFELESVFFSKCHFLLVIFISHARKLFNRYIMWINHHF